MQMTPKQFSDLFDEKYQETVFQAYPDSKESHAILLNDIKKFFLDVIIEILANQYEKIDKEMVSIPASENMEKAIEFNYGLEDGRRYHEDICETKIIGAPVIVGVEADKNGEMGLVVEWPERKKRLNYAQMLEDISHLVENDFCENMELTAWDAENGKAKFKKSESIKMAHIIARIYGIAHCIHCKACQRKYLK